MMPRLPDVRLLAVALVALILALPTLASATPFLWVADDGSDTSADPWSPSTPFATYDRAIAYMNEVGSETVGVKFKPGNRPPRAWQVRQIMSHKKDIINSASDSEVISGHGLLPKYERSESVEAGLVVTREWVWKTYIAPNGQLAEYCDSTPESVESLP